MGLLDHLFKTKPDAAAPAVDRPSERLPDSDRGRQGAGRAMPSGAPPSPAFEAVKAFVARPHGQSLALSSSAPPTPPPAPEVAFTLGDILSRIPTQLLRPGLHDAARVLRFRRNDLEALDAPRPTVLLARIAAQCPGVFDDSAPGFSSIQVGVPAGAIPAEWKIARPLTDGSTAGVAQAPASKPAAAKETPEPAASAAVSRRGAPEQIELSLAAILKRCPRDIITSPLPRIAESVCITLPFAPIAQQLPSGKVEISALRFIAALPPELMDHFHAIEGVKVSLPLQEIFKHLPARAPASSDAAPPAEAAPGGPPATAAAEAVKPEPAEVKETAASALPISETIDPPPAAAESEEHRIAATALPAEPAAPASSTPLFSVAAPPIGEPSAASPATSAAEPAAAVSPRSAPLPSQPRTASSPLLTPAESGALAAMAPPRIRPFAPPPPILAASEAPAPPPDLFDLAQLAETLAALPGIQACVIAARGELATAGALPPGAEASDLRALAAQLTSGVRGAAVPEFEGVRHLTIHGDAFSLSFFLAADASIAAVVRTRSFLPGVCERLRAVAAQLAAVR